MTAVVFPAQAQSQGLNFCASTLTQLTLKSLKVKEGSSVDEIEWARTRTQMGVSVLEELGASKAFELGEGAEGTVYRLIPSGGGPSYLLKSYHPGESEGVHDALKILTYWHDLSHQLPATRSLVIALPRPGPVPHSLEFNDVRGETVLNILRSSAYSHELKVRLIQRLMKAVGDFAADIMALDPTIGLINCCFAMDDFIQTYEPFVDPVPKIFGLQSKVNPNLYFYFSPHNIIYDIENDRFVIIDPV